MDPYIVLAPNIAMPHSTESGDDVHGTEVGFMRVAKPVHFEKGNPDKDARIFFVLCQYKSRCTHEANDAACDNISG